MGNETYVNRYPNPNYGVPPKEELEKVLRFAENIFDDICRKLDIDKDEIVNAK